MNDLAVMNIFRREFPHIAKMERKRAGSRAAQLSRRERYLRETGRNPEVLEIDTRPCFVCGKRGLCPHREKQLRNRKVFIDTKRYTVYD